MGDNARAEAGDGVGSEGLGDGFAPTERVEHGGVGGEIAGPAHADGGADRDGISVKESGSIETGKKPEGSSH